MIEDEEISALGNQRGSLPTTAIVLLLPLKCTGSSIVNISVFWDLF